MTAQQQDDSEVVFQPQTGMAAVLGELQALFEDRAAAEAATSHSQGVRGAPGLEQGQQALQHRESEVGDREVDSILQDSSREERFNRLLARHDALEAAMASFMAEDRESHAVAEDLPRSSATPEPEEHSKMGVDSQQMDDRSRGRPPVDIEGRGMSDAAGERIQSRSNAPTQPARVTQSTLPSNQPQQATSPRSRAGMLTTPEGSRHRRTVTEVQRQQSSHVALPQFEDAQRHDLVGEQGLSRVPENQGSAGQEDGDFSAESHEGRAAISLQDLYQERDAASGGLRPWGQEEPEFDPDDNLLRLPQRERWRDVIQEALGQMAARQQTCSQVALQQMTDRPTQDSQETTSHRPPTYEQAFRDPRWVTAHRGGGAPDGLSANQRDLSQWMQLGAGGRPVGAATQIPEADRVSHAQRQLFTPSPFHRNYGVDADSIHTQEPPVSGHDGDCAHRQIMLAMGETQRRLHELEERLSSEEALRLEVQNRLRLQEEKTVRAEQQAQQERAQQQTMQRAMQRELHQEVMARQDMMNRMTIIQEEGQQREGLLQARLDGEMARRQQIEERFTVFRQGQAERMDTLEAHLEENDRHITRLQEIYHDSLEGLQETVERLATATILPSTPLAASTPNRGVGENTQGDTRSQWSHEATGGSTKEEKSPQLISDSEDPRRPPAARGVHFDERTSPALLRPEAPPARAPGEKANRAVPDLPHFSGKKGESLAEFLRRVQMAAEMGNWDPQFKRNRTHFQLKGQAMQYIEGLPWDQVSTLEGLEGALRERYQGKGVRKDAKEELRILKRRTNESPEDYGLRIQQLTRMAYPDDASTQEEEGVSAFLRGLPDQKSAETFIATKKDTVQECVTTLAETERHRNSVGRTQGPLRLRHLEEQSDEQRAKNKAKASTTPAAQAQAADSELAKVKKELNTVKGQLAAARKRLDQVRQAVPNQQTVRRERGPEQPSSERPCHICGDPTHWANRCPNKGQQSQQSQGPNRPPGNDGGLGPRSGDQSNNNSQQ